MTPDFLDYMPLWVVFCVTVLLILGATEVGFWIGRRRSSKADADNEAQITSMTGAHLALLAFFLAFTFSMAANHYDDRKHIILAETNAIETAYLRSTLIAGPHGENIRALLQEYTLLRLDVGKRDRQDAVLEGSAEIQSKIWQEIQQLASEGQPTVMQSLLVQAINDVFDLHEDRVFVGLRNRIPATIWIVLYAVLSLSMFGVGFHFGIKGSRSTFPSVALALSFSVVLFLIGDLDRPRSGLVKSDNSAVEDLNKRLRR